MHHRRHLLHPIPLLCCHHPILLRRQFPHLHYPHHPLLHPLSLPLPLHLFLPLHRHQHILHHRHIHHHHHHHTHITHLHHPHHHHHLLYPLDLNVAAPTHTMTSETSTSHQRNIAPHQTKTARIVRGKESTRVSSHTSHVSVRCIPSDVQTLVVQRNFHERT